MNSTLSPDSSDLDGKAFEGEEAQVATRATSHDEITGVAERAYLRRLDLMILPMVSFFYFMEYLDRGNVANARLLGLDAGRDTASHGVGPGEQSLSSGQWQTVIFIFYVGLILFQVPGCIGYRIFPPSRWIAFCVCGWCSVSMLQNVATNFAGLVACRIFLGMFEGLFGTGIVYYLSLFYKRAELGRRVFWFLGPTSVAGAFGGLIAFGIGHVRNPAQRWRYLFLVEALPGFVLGLFCLYRLPDHPRKNRRFQGTHRDIAAARYKSESIDKSEQMQRKHVVWALTDWRLYMQVSIYIPTAALLSSISGFLPTIIKELGYESSMANLMTVPPYACAFVLMFIVSYSSDHFGERGLHIAIPSFISAICYIVLVNIPARALHARYALVTITTACVYSTYPPGHAWVANNFGNETKRAIGLGLYTAIGNLGSIAGSFFYPTTDAPSYETGHYLSFAMSLATTLLALANSLALRTINRHRDKKYGSPDPGQVIDITEEGDNSPMYRFIP